MCLRDGVAGEMQWIRRHSCTSLIAGALTVMCSSSPDRPIFYFEYSHEEVTQDTRRGMTVPPWQVHVYSEHTEVD